MCTMKACVLAGYGLHISHRVVFPVSVAKLNSDIYNKQTPVFLYLHQSNLVSSHHPALLSKVCLSLNKDGYRETLSFPTLTSIHII
jgi:hypothetical protein